MIDKQGRITILKWKINIIDLIVILIILTLLPVFPIGVRIKQKMKIKPLPPTYIIHYLNSDTYETADEDSFQLQPQWQDKLNIEIFTWEGERIYP